MEGLVKGDVVVAKYPFSNLSSSKKRPAVVVAKLEGFDPIVCPVSSSYRADKYSVGVSEKDLEDGYLKYESSIRPTSILTLERSLILYKIGHLKEGKINELQERIVQIFNE
jgi:mRNA interferase MazF